MYPSYLIHYNKNHNPKNGQFAPGDGDGDGQVGDRTNADSERQKRRKEAKSLLAVGIVQEAALMPLSIALSAQSYKEGSRFVAGAMSFAAGVNFLGGVHNIVSGARGLKETKA